MADVPSWNVGITEGAEQDLRRLYRRRRPVWQEAQRLLRRLETDADTMGDSLRPPFPEDVRRVHFARDRYRMAWVVREAERLADVLAVDLKSRDFYSRLRDRWEGLIERLSDRGNR